VVTAGLKRSIKKKKIPLRSSFSKYHFLIMKQQDLIPLVAKLAVNKFELQSKFDKGEIPTIAQFAKNNGITRSTADNVLKMLEIRVPSRYKGADLKSKVCSSEILTVLARVCRELNINHDEIKPYL
jgi:hypothetical protein